MSEWCLSAACLWHVWVPTHRIVTVIAGPDSYQIEQYRCLNCGKVSP